VSHLASYAHFGLHSLYRDLHTVQPAFSAIPINGQLIQVRHLPVRWWVFMPYRLSPCDLGDPGWGDPWFPHGAFVASLAFRYGLWFWCSSLCFCCYTMSRWYNVIISCMSYPMNWHLSRLSSAVLFCSIGCWEYQFYWCKTIFGRRGQRYELARRRVETQAICFMYATFGVWLFLVATYLLDCTQVLYQFTLEVPQFSRWPCVSAN